VVLAREKQTKQKMEMEMSVENSPVIFFSISTRKSTMTLVTSE